MNRSQNIMHLIDPTSRERFSDFFKRLYNDFDYYRQQFDLHCVKPQEPIEQILDLIPVCEPHKDYTPLQKSIYQNIGMQRYVADYTSGTTGPSRFRMYSLVDDKAEREICKRLFLQASLNENDRVLALETDCANVYLFFGRAICDSGVKNFYFCCLPAQYQAALNSYSELDPTVIFSIPSLFIRIMKGFKGLLDSGKLRSLKKIIFMGENIPAGLRSMLEQEYGIEVFSFYGTTETGTMAAECKQHQGIHINWDKVIPSLLNPKQIDENTYSGELLWTTPYITHHPVIKFAAHDNVTITTKPCECGLTQPRLLSISRSFEQLSIFGHKMPYQMFVEALKLSKISAKFLQLYVKQIDAKTHITFRLPSELATLRNKIHQAFSDTDLIYYFQETGFLSFKLEFCDKPELTGRKLKSIIFAKE